MLTQRSNKSKNNENNLIYSARNKKGEINSNCSNFYKTPQKQNCKSHCLSSSSNHQTIGGKKKKVIKIVVREGRRNQLDDSTRENTIMCNQQWKISDFSIQKQMGRGKFGFVYAAKEKTSDFVVALKKMSKSELKQNDFQLQVKREVIIQNGLNHPNILKLFGYFWDQENVYLILQYAPEGQLFNLLRKFTKFSEQTVSVIIRQVCQGLKYLHSCFVLHRDIKPENILISGKIVKIADFGWSIQSDVRRETLCGTLDYLAPEIVKGETHDRSIDVWQVGILAYQLAVGHPPFETSLSEQTYRRILYDQIFFPAHVSYNLRQFIRKVLQKQADKRLKIQEILQLPFIQQYISSQLFFL